jgi:hypothetical protein
VCLRPLGHVSENGDELCARGRLQGAEYTRIGVCCWRVPGKSRRRRHADSIAQADPQPVTLGGDTGQRGVGIDRNRVRDLFQQRQVVVRVAVEPALHEAAQPEAERFEPGVDALDLAFAERGGAARLSGEAAVLLRGDGRDQVRDAELAGDRSGDEAVGGGDDGQQVAGFGVPPHQGACRRADQRTDARGEEFAVPGVEFRARMARQRRQLEIEEGMDVQRAGLVLLEKIRGWSPRGLRGRARPCRSGTAPIRNPNRH